MKTVPRFIASALTSLHSQNTGRRTGRDLRTGYIHTITLYEGKVIDSRYPARPLRLI